MSPRRLLAALTLALVAAPALAAESDYTCKRSLFGCYTSYVGGRTAADAEAYISDAQAAIDEIMQTVPGVNDAHYHPKRGLVVVEEKKDQLVNYTGLTRITEIMRARHLRVDRVVAMTPGFRWVHFAKEVRGDNGGRSRYLALSKVKLDKAAVSAGTNDSRARALRALRYETTDTFGNIRIEF
ncbi:hypothetical protein LAZ40_06785 [Cereibacter sphaeroides]|uniref:hypothetical protein n=1 Tax=Cereibacter sphaeroides TaxID=1063 RepID=UPI001F39D175|nr:hypothetical protein [Cereibacter sphaeroides]MCE6958752.1 hypothetical protein [Cereibacter sphaeroides]MCE6973374.1 hypothetical protein [Cereibacter sphaeroides]